MKHTEINFDAMGHAELEAASKDKTLHQQQRLYAASKFLAFGARAYGSIEGAKRYEAQAERHYKALPKYLRW